MRDQRTNKLHFAFTQLWRIQQFVNLRKKTVSVAQIWYKCTKVVTRVDEFCFIRSLDEIHSRARDPQSVPSNYSPCEINAQISSICVHTTLTNPAIREFTKKDDFCCPNLVQMYQSCHPCRRILFHTFIRRDPLQSSRPKQSLPSNYSPCKINAQISCILRSHNFDESSNSWIYEKRRFLLPKSGTNVPKSSPVSPNFVSCVH
jgi:hypothetical protein